jgi:hypothetical protein
MKIALMRTMPNPVILPRTTRAVSIRPIDTF